MLTGAVSFTACSGDDLDTNQYNGGVGLNVYGPTPVMRGGTLRFLGSNLDQISQIEIPGVAPITNIEVVKAGVPSEIRIVVPHDGPQPGLVKLTTKTGETITTITELNYIEGLNPANITISPASAMAGDKIRITVPENGDEYLDIIHMVEFAEGVFVGESDFTAHSRYLIELTVPEEAKTGKLNLYTADLTNTEVDADNVEYQIITTEKALEVGVPTITKFASPRGEANALGTITVKAGETVTITGEYLSLVDAIEFGDQLITEFKREGKTVSATLPAEAPDGDINIVTLSGVEVPVGKYITVKPSEVAVAPNPVKAGAELTITGKDLDVVTSVEFPNADAQSGEAITVAADKIVVKAVPEKAIDGNITLRMANGAGVEVAYTLVKPIVTGYDKTTVSAGGTLTIQGKDLDLVKSVKFGESDNVIVENATSETITLTVPMNATSGAPTLTLANGTTVEGVPAINIEEAVFCYATALPGDDAELKAGESLVLTVANGDKLTGVQIDGTDCQYVLVKDNTELIIGVPTTAKSGSKVRLISSNGEITYSIDFIPNTEVTTVLWTGASDLDGWSWNWEIGKGAKGDNNPNMFKDMGLQEGDIIRIYATNYNDWWQVQFFDGHWGKQEEIGNATGLNNGNNINSGIYNLAEHNGAIEIVATPTLVEHLTTLTDWGTCWILQGEGVVITKIAVTHYNSLETELWKGEAIVDNWGNQPYILSDGGTELLEAGMKVGSILRIYLTPTEDSWNCQVVDGHWGPTFDGCDFSSGNWNLAEHNGAIEVTITDAIYAAITTAGGWGGSFILNGDNCICTKVTIE